MNICSMYALGSKASFTKVCFNAYEEFYIFKVNVIGPLRFKASQPLVNNYKYSYITICKNKSVVTYTSFVYLIAYTG